MKRFIRTLYQSFYSKELYRDAAYNWNGIGIGLLAWLALFVTIIFVIMSFGMSGDSYNNGKAELLNQMPNVTISKGILSIDRPTPYYFSFTGAGHVALIDTSDTASKLSLDDTLKIMQKQDLKIFVAKDKIITLEKPNESKVYDLSEQKQDMKFGKTEVALWIKYMEIFGLPFLFGMLYLCMLLYALLQMLIYSLFALIVNRSMNAGLNYPALQRITVCALFPVPVIDFAFLAVNSEMPFLISFVCTIIFIMFGVKSAKLYAHA